MSKAKKTLERIEGCLIIVFMVLMVCASLFQVLNRNVLKLGVAWAEEVARYSMIWMAMIATGVSVRKGMQMSIIILKKKIKGLLLRVLEILKSMLILGFCTVIMVSITDLIKTQIDTGQLSPALKLPMYIPTFAVFLGMLLICIFEVSEVVNLLRNKKDMQEDGLIKEGASLSVAESEEKDD